MVLLSYVFEELVGIRSCACSITNLPMLSCCIFSSLLHSFLTVLWKRDFSESLTVKFYYISLLWS